MASREMIDVLQRLRELDEKNPNVHTDALENAEKLNPPVEEAKAKPDYIDLDKDGNKKEPMKKAAKDAKKKKMDEAITISADSPEDLPVLQQIMKLAGMTPVTPDMMPDGDNVPVMKAEPGCGTPTFDNAPDEQYKGVEDVTTQTGYGDANGPKHPQDLRVKDPTPYGDYKARLAKLAGIETEGVDSNLARPIDPNSVFARLGNDIQSIMNDALDGNDMADEIADELGDYLRNGEAPEGSHYEKAIGIVMDAIHDGPKAQAEAAEEAISFLHSEEKNPKFADEGYANSMGNEKEDPTYKGYDPDYADHTEDGRPKVRYVPSRYGDNALESMENKLMKEYQEYVKEKELTKPEAKEKERLVKGMKKSKADFKKRYGDDAKAVMYATATKMAKERK